MRYRANPVEVDAEIITEVGGILGNGSIEITIQSGRKIMCHKGMVSRMIPQPGDYIVRQADGYVYLNPKDVFERKYSPIPDLIVTNFDPAQAKAEGA